jgi:hypothetical protein
VAVRPHNQGVSEPRQERRMIGGSGPGGGAHRAATGRERRARLSRCDHARTMGSSSIVAAATLHWCSFKVSHRRATPSLRRRNDPLSKVVVYYRRIRRRGPARARGRDRSFLPAGVFTPLASPRLDDRSIGGCDYRCNVRQHFSSNSQPWSA